jgi:two-component system cell cycle sensor histidine kinase/response regulator CckA
MEAAALIDDPGGSIDVAVIDIVLQDRNGIEIAREVRARHPDVTLVHISGYADEDLDGVPEDVILLRKPFTGQQLRSAMASASGS